MAESELSSRRKRQSWYGLKRPIKKALAVPGLSQAAHAVTKSRRGESAAARLPAPLTVHSVQGRVNGLTYVMNDPSQCIIAKELYWGDGQRPSAQDQFALEVFARLAGNADRVLDIGSYTGVFSLVAAKANRAARVEAFEIVPSNFLACWGNVITNDLVGRVDVHLQGVGAPGLVRMPAATAGSALPDFWSLDDGDGGAGSGIEVPVVSLDEVLADQEGGEVLIKVDVEGHESALVRHGGEAIARIRPVFVMEILPGADVSELEAVFRPSEYRYYLIGERELRPADQLSGVDAYRDWLITTALPAELETRGIAVSLN